MFDKPKLSEQNEMGFQFGINKSLTDYAHRTQMQWGNNTLPSLEVTVLEAWKDDKLDAYLLIDEKTNKAIKEVTAGYEACACAIDALKVAKNAEELEKNI